MTIPVGRRRLVLSLRLLSPATHRLNGLDPLDANDAELARIGRRTDRDVDRLRWEAMTLLYGGQVRS